MTADTTTPAQSPSGGLSRRSFGPLLLLGMLVVLVLRGVSERAMMDEFGSDPQMGIWMMFMIVGLAFWLLTGCAVAGVLLLGWKNRWGFAVGAVLLFGWTVAISLYSWQFYQSRQALVDARDPATSPARLEQLLQFNGIQAGYELDNRIASNPNATPEILRQLYERHNSGTLMILARSSRTPTDVLQAIVDHDLNDATHGSSEEWIRKGLKQNPSLPDALREKLNESEQRATE